MQKDFDGWNKEKKQAQGKVQGKEATALLSQIRVIDTRRLIEKIGFLERSAFTNIRKAVRILF